MPRERGFFKRENRFDLILIKKKRYTKVVKPIKKTESKTNQSNLQKRKVNPKDSFNILVFLNGIENQNKLVFFLCLVGCDLPLARCGATTNLKANGMEAI